MGLRVDREEYEHFHNYAKDGSLHLWTNYMIERMKFCQLFLKIDNLGDELIHSKVKGLRSWEQYDVLFTWFQMAELSKQIQELKMGLMKLSQLLMLVKN